MIREGMQEAIAPSQDWRPQSLLARRPPWLSPRLRAAVLAVVLLAHLGVAVWLPWLDRGTQPPPDEALVVGFIDREPLPEPPPDHRDPPPASSVPPSRLTPAPRKRSVVQQPLQVQQVTRQPPQPLDLYGEDGRPKVPDDMLEQIDRKFSDTRTFDYQVPGMEDADKLLNRPPPITFERTRFDEYWTPDRDLLTALLTKMAEKTTKEIRVPVPGRAGSTMVCHVSLLALGGSCGVLTPGSDYVGPVDDPDTLSPEEDRQCQAWWEQIVGATTQDAWRKTRKLYEAQCRKPLERAPAG